MHLHENTVLNNGKYRVIRFISSGGFGCTYEAEHILLGKRMAIKEFFVKDFCNRDGDTRRVTVGTVSKKPLVDKLLKKFIEEAQGISRLEHPAIVHVTDVFEENGTAYFVMDYIDGESLSSMVERRGAIPEDEALSYILPVCDALQHVHTHNRLHLDVKPANIMVDKNGRAVLIDFGASKQYDEEAGENTSTLIGQTPGYAPPEQLSNNVVKFMPATDVYSLGATLYKLLTGNTPPEANLRTAGDVELDPLPETVSKNVRDAVEMAMNMRKNKRQQSMLEFKSMLTAKVPESATSSTGNVPPKVPGLPPRAPKDANYQTGDDHTRAIGGNYHGMHNPQQPIIGDPTPYVPDGASKKSGGSKKVLIIVIVVLAVVLGVILALMSGADGENNTTGTDTAAVETVDVINVVDMVYTKGKNTYTYTGECTADSVPNGKGKGVYKTHVYEGEYVNGVRQGHGVNRENNGDVFEGEYRDDLHYDGKYTVAEDKSYYQGTFDGNENPLNGTWYKPDGSVDMKIAGGKPTM